MCVHSCGLNVPLLNAYQMSGFMMSLKGLPSTYNKDLQEDKEPLFDTLDTVSASLRIAEGVISTLDVRPPSCSVKIAPADFSVQVDADKMRAALTPDMLATDLADYLVRKGVPFRETHHISGRAVALAEAEKKPLSTLTLQQLQGLCPKFTADVKDVFDFEASIERRDAIGGPSRRMVDRQIAALRKALA